VVPPKIPKWKLVKHNIDQWISLCNVYKKAGFGAKQDNYALSSKHSVLPHFDGNM
jgi:hypothetical protein